VLTQRGAEALIRIERLMEDASRALAAVGTAVSALPAGSPDPAPRADALASASEGSTSSVVRGN
jgi:hypothetical protein